jgi:hypothetical protein
MGLAATGVLILIVAVVLDWGGVGPSSIRDRVAFVFAIVGSYALWADTPAVDAVARALREGVRDVMTTFGAKPGPADPALIVTGLVTLLAFISILALWSDGHPDDDTGPDGRHRSGALRALASKVSLRCREDRRLNPRVWFIGVPMGALAPLAGGLIGGALQFSLSFAPSLINAGIYALFVGGAR